jgi:hypothetical protein
MNSTKRCCQPPPSSVWGLSRRDDIIGVSVIAITAETTTAPASVNANSWNRAPVRPPWKPIGT